MPTPEISQSSIDVQNEVIKKNVATPNRTAYGMTSPSSALSANDSLPAGFQTDSTGRIFKVGDSAGESSVVSSTDSEEEFKSNEELLNEKIDSLGGGEGGDSGSGDGAGGGGDIAYDKDSHQVTDGKDQDIRDQITEDFDEQRAVFEKRAEENLETYDSIFSQTLAGLNSTAQSTIEGLKVNYAKRINEQRRINEVRIARVKAYGLGGDNARFNPMGYTDALTTREEEAGDKILSLENERNSLIAKAESALSSGRADLLRQSIEDINSVEDRLATQLNTLNDESSKQYDLLRTYRKEQEAEHEEKLAKQLKQFGLLASSFMDDYDGKTDAEKTALIQRLVQETGLSYGEIYAELEIALSEKKADTRSDEEYEAKKAKESQGDLRTVDGSLYQVTYDDEGKAVLTLLKKKEDDVTSTGGGGSSSSTTDDTTTDDTTTESTTSFSEVPEEELVGTTFESQSGEDVLTLKEFEQAMSDITDEETGEHLYNQSDQTVVENYREYLSAVGAINPNEEASTDDSGGGAQSTEIGSRVTTDAKGKTLSNQKQTSADAKLVTTFLDSVSGSDGYVSPEDYAKAKKQWVKFGYTAENFDNRFNSSYANPSHDGYKLGYADDTKKKTHLA